MRGVVAFLAALLLVRCTLVTCDDICDVPVDAGASGGGAGGGVGGMDAGDAPDAGDAGEAPDAGDAGELDGGLDGGFDGGTDAGEPDSGTPRASVVFVTSGRFTGNFISSGVPGAAGADRYCTNAAMAASLPGNFKALVAGAAGQTPSSRLADASPWVLNGTTTVVFATKASLAAFPPAPINRDQNGTVIVANPAVWTGASNVNTTGANCSTWSSTTGAGIVGSASSAVQWLSTGVDAGCSTMARLYCFEQP